jgi:TRAP transporter TAXI family solute receptor
VVPGAEVNVIGYLKRRPLVLVVLAAALLVAAVAWAVFVLGNAVPPRRLVMTTGPEGGAYREFGERYRSFLARYRVRLELRPSLGNVENPKRLQDPRSGVSVGFVSGGLTTESESPNLVSLGTVAHYPMWIFCRGMAEPIRVKDLKGKRVSVGPEGGGTRPLALELLRANEIENMITPVALAPGPSGEALIAGQIDCACMLTTADAPVVRKLLAREDVSLVSFPRAEAYVAHYPYLRRVVVPEGVGSLSKNLPRADVPLVASTASLLIREDLHPAIQFLLLQAADEIHSPGGVLSRPGQFPSPEPVDVPLSSEAKPFYKSGGSFLQRHLPFWLWIFVSRFLLLLVPLVGIIYPLSQAIPAGIDLVVDLRLSRIYRELRNLEARKDRIGSRDNLGAALDALERRVAQMRVPARNLRSVYFLRQHLILVRGRLLS